MLRIFKQYYPIQNFIFFAVEGFIIFSSILLASVLLTFSNSTLYDILLLLRIILATTVIQVSLYYNDLYDFQISSTLTEIGIRLCQALGASSIILALIYMAFPLVIIARGIFLLSITFLFVFIIAWRLVYIVILNRGTFNTNILILGSGDLAFDIIAKIKNNIDCGYAISGLIPDPHDDNCEKKVQARVPLLKKAYADLADLAKKQEIQKIVVTLGDKRKFFPSDALLACRVAGIEVLEGNTFYEMLSGKLLVTELTPSWLIFSDGFQKSTSRIILKRVFDITTSLILLILLLPLLLVTALLIKMESKGPVFFTQDRVGLHKKEYMMHKFRSMVDNAEQLSGPVWAMDNDDRITRVGRFIRKCRVDELPQLWDVLMGKMSLVGPRPERKHFTDKLEAEIPFYSLRFVVKPGITGWAQVNYDYGASVEDAVEKLNYDLFYIKNMSIMMDIMIVLKTIKTVLFGKGAR